MTTEMSDEIKLASGESHPRDFSVCGYRLWCVSVSSVWEYAGGNGDMYWL